MKAIVTLYHNKAVDKYAAWVFILKENENKQIHMIPEELNTYEDFETVKKSVNEFCGEDIITKNPDEYIWEEYYDSIYRVIINGSNI